MLLNDLLDLALELGCDVALSDLGEKGAVGRGKVLTELSLPLGDLVDGNGVEETVDTGVDDGDLDLHGEGLVLALLCRELSVDLLKTSDIPIHTEELSETGATREKETSGGIQVGAELSEGSDLTVLSKVELERTSELLHDLAVINCQRSASSPNSKAAYVWAAEPTRETERPTLMAGRTPRKKSSASKKI